MAYEYPDINSLHDPDHRPAWYERLLLTMFPSKVAESVAHILIDFISALRKLCVYLSLPLKFLQFFRQSLAEQNANTNRDK